MVIKRPFCSICHCSFSRNESSYMEKGKADATTRGTYSGIIFVTDAEEKKNLGILWCVHRNQRLVIYLLDLGWHFFIRKCGNACRYCFHPDHLLFYRNGLKSASFRGTNHKIFRLANYFFWTSGYIYGCYFVADTKQRNGSDSGSVSYRTW